MFVFAEERQMNSQPYRKMAASYLKPMGKGSGQRLRAHCSTLPTYLYSPPGTSHTGREQLPSILRKGAILHNYLLRDIIPINAHGTHNCGDSRRITTGYLLHSPRPIKLKFSFNFYSYIELTYL